MKPATDPVEPPPPPKDLTMAKTATRKKTTRKATPPPQVLKATTLYLTAGQHAWLRRKALDHSIEHGGRADASAVARHLFDAAMKGKARR